MTARELILLEHKKLFEELDDSDEAVDEQF
jgi:hypothetical protein